MTDSTLFAVMKYLKDNHYYQTWLTLQTQAQIKLHSYPKQIQFLKKILLKGDFDEVIKFFSTLQSHISEQYYKKACLTIYKQKLYQLIDVPNQHQLKILFQKQLITCCTQEQFQNIFSLLTSRKTQQIPGLNDWTIIKGRTKVFQQILPIIQTVLRIDKNNNSYSNTNIIDINLDQAIALYLQKINKNNNNLSKINQHYNNLKNISQNYSKMSNPYNKSTVKKEQQEENLQEIELGLSQSQYNNNQSKINFQKKSQIYKDNKSSVNQGFSNSKIHEKNNIYSKPQINNQIFEQDAQINEISQQEQKSSTIRQRKYEISNKKSSPNSISEKKSNNNSQYMDQQSRQNIQYLQQTNSVVYNNDIERQQQNFTFSQNQLAAQMTKPRQIVKLATISDNKAIRTCQFSQSGNFFAVGTNSSYLKIFYLQDLFNQNKSQQNIQPIYEINNLHSKSIFCLDWAKNQNSMVTCSNDLTIKLTQFDQQFTSHQISVIGRHQSCIRMVKFNHDHNKIFSCGDDSLIKIWDMGKVKRCYNLKGHKSGISAFKLTQNQNQLYSVSKDSTIKRWDLRSLDCIATCKPQQSQMTFIANNTDRIVASNRNGNILFFDENLNFQYQIKIHEQQIRSIQCSKSKDQFITASFDGHVAMFSQKTCHSPDYFQHNQNGQDKVVFATFLEHPQYKGFASTSTLGLCHIYSYF